jgi:hypothetical protein
MSVRGIAAILLLALTSPQVAGAQTATSLRIRSMGVSFSGILDDYLTDVYLNPARISQLDRPMAYTVAYPSEYFRSPYLYARLRYYNRLTVEQFYQEHSFSPIGLSYFGTIGKSLAFSIAAEIDVYGRDVVEQGNDIAMVFQRVVQGSNEHGRVTDNQHCLLDLTLAPAGRDNPFGARLTLLYDSAESGEGNYRQTTEWDTGDLERIYYDHDGDLQQTQYEKLSVGVSLGLFRPDGFVRDVVIRGNVNAETFDVDSRDMGGDRIDEGDYTISSDYRKDAYLSGREYNGYAAGARVQLGWSERVRSTHALDWSHMSGDGDASFQFDEESFNGSTYGSNTQSQFRYDGSSDGIRFESTIGYFNNLFDNVLFAFALFGSYSRSEFDEDGVGEAGLRWYDDGIGVDTTFSSPYQQNHNATFENVRLSVPMAVEWAFHKYAKLRLGVTLTASRIVDDHVSTQEASKLGVEFDRLTPTNFDSALDMRSGVDAVYLSGFEINLKDRFVVDLYSYYTSSINFADYGYISVRYKF